MVDADGYTLTKGDTARAIDDARKLAKDVASVTAPVFQVVLDRKRELEKTRGEGYASAVVVMAIEWQLRALLGALTGPNAAGAAWRIAEALNNQERLHVELHDAPSSNLRG